MLIFNQTMVLNGPIQKFSWILRKYISPSKVLVKMDGFGSSSVAVPRPFCNHPRAKRKPLRTSP